MCRRVEFIIHLTPYLSSGLMLRACAAYCFANRHVDLICVYLEVGCYAIYHLSLLELLLDVGAAQRFASLLSACPNHVTLVAALLH